MAVSFVDHLSAELSSDSPAESALARARVPLERHQQRQPFPTWWKLHSQRTDSRAEIHSAPGMRERHKWRFLVRHLRLSP